MQVGQLRARQQGQQSLQHLGQQASAAVGVHQQR